MSGLPCASQQALRILSVCGGVSAFFRRRRSPGDSHVNSKCWYDLMPGIDLKCGDRKPDQLYVGTLIVPSCSATSCAVLHTADFSTVSLMSLRQVDVGAPIQSLEESKAPIWTELGMSHHQETQPDPFVSPCRYPPHHVLHHSIILVLTDAVICMEICFILAKTVVIKKVVQPTNYSICPFPPICGFIGEKVHLSWNTFTSYTENGTFPACEKVNWSRLEWIGWEMNQLGVIKAVVYRCGS